MILRLGYGNTGYTSDGVPAQKGTFASRFVPPQKKDFAGAHSLVSCGPLECNMVIKEVLIAVSQQSVFLAEARIRGCIVCSKHANVFFETVLDEVTGRSEPASYVLPSPALCPICDAPITETTLVEVPPRRHR